jgi:hypothetical protein
LNVDFQNLFSRRIRGGQGLVNVTAGISVFLQAMNPFQSDPSNALFQLAADYVNHTSRPVFLTGKAGTGKTTFLKYIRTHTPKQTVVVAPTGVAAINAGGVTMHSFFQLPFGPYLPILSNSLSNRQNQITDQHSLFKNIRFYASKRLLLKELELLIIDEISMVRADTLDAIDIILRHFRKNFHQPFGGVQVLFIGDLFQLPPVMPPDQWEILKDHYESPFFFHSKVIREDPPVYIELKKIYRQNDPHFIGILNRVRNNEVLASDLEILNNLYQPAVHSTEANRFITLTTHNWKADQMNSFELEKLPGEVFSFNSVITGEFPDKSVPTDKLLRLKVGAQVMFIKNELGEQKRFFNGKLAVITSITIDKITVKFPDIELTMELEKETWRNIRYVLNEQTGEIEEEVQGTFTQYPIRLAWAITIHKSQGLTFEKAIIDAGNAFAPGQVYVALSRCTTLEGIIFHSKIYAQAIKTDEQVISFSALEADPGKLEQNLQSEKSSQALHSLSKYFECTKITATVQQHIKATKAKKHADKEYSLKHADLLYSRTLSLQETAGKFSKQLHILINEFRENQRYGPLRERVSAAVQYFSKVIEDEIVKEIETHLKFLHKKPKTLKYCKELETLQIQFRKKLSIIQNAGELVRTFENNVKEVC